MNSVYPFGWIVKVGFIVNIDSKIRNMVRFVLEESLGKRAISIAIDSDFNDPVRHEFAADVINEGEISVRHFTGMPYRKGFPVPAVVVVPHLRPE